MWLQLPFLSQDVLLCKSAGYKEPGLLFGEDSWHPLNHKTVCHGPDCCEGWMLSTLSGVSHTELDLCVPWCWKEAALSVAKL